MYPLLGLHFVGLVHCCTAIRPKLNRSCRSHPRLVSRWEQLVFFFFLAFRKWERKHTKTSTQTPGLYCTKTKSLNSTRPLSRLIYIIFLFLFRSVHAPIRTVRYFLHHDLGLLGNQNRLYMYTGHGHLFLFLSSSLRPCATFGREGYSLDLVSPCRLRITRLRLLGMSEDKIPSNTPQSIASCNAHCAGGPRLRVSSVELQISNHCPHQASYLR